MFNKNRYSFRSLPSNFNFVQIDEHENLPKCICDSCIIQLNVAYNLKKAAVQSDIKLRQYVIEYGVNVTSYTTCINTVSIVRPPGILMASNSSNSPSMVTTATSAIVTTEKQTTTSESIERPTFAVMPMVIKEEPIDYEVMSDITIESNAYEENGTNEMARPSNSTTASAASTIIARRKEKPLASDLMVAVNDKSLLASSSTSDVDYINAYMQTTPSSGSDASPSESTSPIQAPVSKPSESTDTASSLAKNQTPANVNGSPQNVQTPSKKKKANTPPKKQNTRQQKQREAPRELRMLHINLSKISNVILNGDSRPSRTSMGQIAPKNYFEAKKMHDQGKSNRNQSMETTMVGERSQRERLIRSSNQKNSPKRQEMVVSPAMKKMKLSLRQRSSL